MTGNKTIAKRVACRMLGNHYWMFSRSYKIQATPSSPIINMASKFCVKCGAKKNFRVGIDMAVKP